MPAVLGHWAARVGAVLSRWARVGEVLGIGVIAVVCLPLFAGWRPEIGLFGWTFTTELVEFLMVGLISIWWVGLCFLFPLTPRGRAWIRDDAGPRLMAANIADRADSLTIAGLVLAGLAIGPASTLGRASTPLVAAFAAFIAAWGAGFLPGRISSTLARDALHWIGLGCVLAAVFSMAIELDPDTLGPRVAIFGGSLAVSVYSFLHARAHWRGAQSTAVPPEGAKIADHKKTPGHSKKRGPN
jgi:hypothetical protein